MVHRSAEREPSVGSSTMEADRFEENEKNRSDASFVKLKAGGDEESGDDVERAELLPEEHAEKSEPAPAPVKPDNSTRTAMIWMVVNTLATIGIVFTNKAIFSDPSLKLAQLTFAAFHFFITWLTLFTLSRPRFAMFTPRRVAIKEIIPLAITMALNVILPNLSLAFSTVTFYQVARILLTPTVALMNFVLYKSTLPRNAILALIPACLGVGMVSYYDSLPSADANVATTSTLGVIFAFSGIFASSLYTVWIASYHKKLQMNSMQLLFNQAPLAAFMLLYVIPFVDTFPTWTELPINRWVMIMMSGFFACIINMSQFFIIAQTGPVSSTVVGHVKTCTIVGLGWLMSGRAVGDKSVIGVFVAIGGIITYSIVMLKHKAQGGK
ncbi:triose-phosphate transporter family-domain-containing protein [Amylocarpus encephaloides]|uniref:Triose-phosphate transporter family-domain-containing protein n=1 Tax=Amylocarpus encephaloides TaxID=45428 RepID=A0A9P7Y5U3_9HELO|nr:triose-phosphate transporter family-domain-containing protein [Amylocarpus encephaloides]